LRSTRDAALHKVEVFQQIVQHFNDVFPSENTETLFQIDQLKEQFETLIKREVIQKKRFQRLKASISAHSVNENNLKTEIVELQETIQKLKNELTIEQSRKVSNESDHSDSESIENMKLELEKQKEICRKLKREIFELNQQIMNSDQTLKNRFEIEKIQLKKTFEITISQLTTQSHEQLESIKKLTNLLSFTKSKLNQTKKFVRKLTEEKQHLEAEMQSSKEDMERRIHLNETQTRSRCLALDSKYQEKLDQVKAKFAAENCDLFSSIARMFSLYFCLSDPIDERALRKGLERAKDDLFRLTNTEHKVKTLLGTIEGQTIEDAVAQRILFHDPHFND
jgi:chromosome segregation ATPase